MTHRIPRPATATAADDAKRAESRRASILCAVLAARNAAKVARELQAQGFAPEYVEQARELARINMQSARRLKTGA